MLPKKIIRLLFQKKFLELILIALTIAELLVIIVTFSMAYKSFTIDYDNRNKIYLDPAIIQIVVLDGNINIIMSLGYYNDGVPKYGKAIFSEEITLSISGDEKLKQKGLQFVQTNPTDTNYDKEKPSKLSQEEIKTQSVKNSIKYTGERTPFVLAGLTVKEHETLFVGYQDESQEAGKITLEDFKKLLNNADDKLNFKITARDVNNDIIISSNCIINSQNIAETLDKNYWHTSYCKRPPNFDR